MKFKPTYTVTVTQEDIDEARKADKDIPASSRCPVARAWQRETGDEGATVGFTSLFTSQRNYYAAPNIFYFVDRFDRGDPVEPFAFFAEKVW